jgi:HAD superfamily phosphatase (TIGR01668 family)
MSAFQPGHFKRENLFAPIRAFCPVRAELKIEDVNLEGLQKRGKKLIMLDLDNTLTTWRSEDFEPSVVKWIQRAHEMGFHLALISNSIKGHRSHRVGNRFGIPVFRGRWKPSRTNYRKALAFFHLQPEDAIMLGDQLLTDVLGANRTGVEAVWIKPRGEAEFKGTKVNRWIERRLMPHLYRAITEEEFPGEAEK